MTNNENAKPQTYEAEVDKQDGGPGSHSESGTGGDRNDVASGGVSSEHDSDK